MHRVQFQNLHGPHSARKSHQITTQPNQSLVEGVLDGGLDERNECLVRSPVLESAEEACERVVGYKVNLARFRELNEIFSIRLNHLVLVRLCVEKGLVGVEDYSVDNLHYGTSNVNWLVDGLAGLIIWHKCERAGATITAKGLALVCSRRGRPARREDLLRECRPAASWSEGGHLLPFGAPRSKEESRLAPSSLKSVRGLEGTVTWREVLGERRVD